MECEINEMKCSCSRRFSWDCGACLL